MKNYLAFFFSMIMVYVVISCFYSYAQLTINYMEEARVTWYQAKCAAVCLSDITIYSIIAVHPKYFFKI